MLLIGASLVLLAWGSVRVISGSAPLLGCCPAWASSPSQVPGAVPVLHTSPSGLPGCPNLDHTPLLPHPGLAVHLSPCTCLSLLQQQPSLEKTEETGRAPPSCPQHLHHASCHLLAPCRTWTHGGVVSTSAPGKLAWSPEGTEAGCTAVQVPGLVTPMSYLWLPSSSDFRSQGTHRPLGLQGQSLGLRCHRLAQTILRASD